MRTSRYPELSVGDLVARCFHDWDNIRGLKVDGGAMLFGDGHVDEGATKDLALAAARAGTNDVEAAFKLGREGRDLAGEALYATVREATGADRGSFLTEAMVPRLSTANPGQNWRARNVESLWESSGAQELRREEPGAHVHT